MSFRRFVQHDLCKNTRDPYEMIRLAMVIINNVVANDDPKYRRVRLVKITTLSRDDKRNLTQLLCRIGFILSTDNMEEILTLKKMFGQDVITDLEYIIKDLSDAGRRLKRDNNEIIKANNRLVEKIQTDVKERTENALNQFKQDRKDVAERKEYEIQLRTIK